MSQSFNFPTPPSRPLRERIRHAQTIEEVQSIALALLDEIESTRAGLQCSLCSAPCEFVPRDS